MRGVLLKARRLGTSVRKTRIQHAYYTARGTFVLRARDTRWVCFELECGHLRHAPFSLRSRKRLACDVCTDDEARRIRAVFAEQARQRRKGKG